MTTPLITELTPEQIRAAVVDRYGQVASNPTGTFNFPVGRAFAEAIGYPPATLDRLPDEASRSFAGVTYYHGRTNLQPGETVLDLGTGAGMDILIAAHAVGETGKVIAIDYSKEMVALARANAKRAGVTGVEIHQAPIERLPVTDATIDIAQANGVFNLSAAKEQAVSEVYRTLKPGGRLIAAEIALTRDVPAAERATMQDWFR